LSALDYDKLVIDSFLSCNRLDPGFEIDLILLLYVCVYVVLSCHVLGMLLW